MGASFLKKVGTLAAMLLAAWVISIYRQVPHRKAPFAKAVQKAERLRMEKASGRVSFVKQKGAWSVELSSGVYAPVDEMPWKSLLSSLSALTLEDEISDRADRASEFEVDAASGMRLVLEDAQGNVLADGIFGKQASDYVHLYYRPSQAVNVYMARGLYRGELGQVDPQAWRSRELVSIPEPQIKRVRIESKGRPTDLVRVSTSSWTSNGKPVQAELVYGLLAKLARLRADSFVDVSLYPAITYASLTYARVMIEGEQSSAEVRIGPLDKKTPRYPLSSGQENGIAWLSQATTDSILKFNP